MIQNPTIFVINAEGDYLQDQRGTIRALSNYQSKIFVVLPFDDVSVRINYLIKEAKREVIGQFLAPTLLYGRDVLAPTDPSYNEAATWKVWAIEISQQALHRIAKYRAGSIGVSFEFTDILPPSQIGTFKGLLNIGSTLPNPTTHNTGIQGDYYIANAYNLNIANIDGNPTLTEGDYVYFDEGDQIVPAKWIKGQNIRLVANTETTDLAVDPSLQAAVPEDVTANQTTLNLIGNLTANFASLQSTVTTHVDSRSDPHEVQANQVESDNGNVQDDLDALDSNINDIIDGNTNITYDNSNNNIIQATTVAGAIGELDSALDAHIENKGNPHAVNSNQITATGNITVQQAIDLLQANKVEKNPDTITSVSGTNKVYVNDGSEKLITVSNLKTSIIEDLVAFGYVKFTTKDEDGQPVIANPQTNKIYLYDPSDSNIANDQYEEWIYIAEDNTFELIGTTGIELDDYYDKVETDALLDDLQDNIDGKANTVHTHIISDVTNLQSALDGKSNVGHLHDDRYYTETELNNGQLDTRYYTETETNTLLDGRVSITGDDISGILNFTGVDKVHLQQNGVPLISTFKATGSTDGQNTFIGLAGNTTMGSSATQVFHASFNTAVGFNALTGNTLGFANNAIGRNALQNNTTANGNNALGVNALQLNTTGILNNAVGADALRDNTTGNSNQAIGSAAGRFIANGSTANATGSNSVFIGSDTKALANGQTNQVVIGHNATGNGSNTVTLGNNSIVSTHLKGNVVASTATFSGEITAPSIVIGSWRIVPDDSSATLNFQVV